MILDRPRVYASFDATGSKNPAATDLKYYYLLRAWLKRGPLVDAFVDVHQAPPAMLMRKPSQALLEGELKRRLAASDALLLIVSARTASSEGWLGWEVEEGAGRLRLPLICSYVGWRPGQNQERPDWWPPALHRLLQVSPGHTVRHVGFRAAALAETLRPVPASRPEIAVRASDGNGYVRH